MENLKCNACGKTRKTKNGTLQEDALEIVKDWGYFSKKDLQRHSFTVCEECYDKWIRTFAIPPEITERNEAL